MTARVAALGLAFSLGGCAMNPIDSLTFFPDRTVPDPPSGVEERWITAADGTRLHAWYAGSPDRLATLVWSHGNGGNIAGRLPMLLELTAGGVSVLAYDYRGYGRSEGRPSEHGAYLDAEAAYDSERARGVPPNRIVCFGESLGGAVAIRLATVRPCAAVAVVATFTSLRDVARIHYGPFGRFAGERFDSLAIAPRLAVPFFAAHGDRDEIVPFELGERLFDAVRAPKRFVRLRGAHHNDIFGDLELVRALLSFVRESVG